LAVLRRAGLVTKRKDGSSVIYALADPLVADLLAVARRLLLVTLAPTGELIADLTAEVGDA
jgi:ArsR family transcriptional regulator